MNYQRIYDQLINKARSKNRKKYKRSDSRYIYYENHHIIPKCIGGINDKENLILLTAPEHYVAHQLLVKIYPKEYKLIFALRILCTNKHGNQVRNNKEYEWIRKAHAKISSTTQKGKPSDKKGKPSPLRGRKQSQDVIEHRARKNTGQKRNENTKLKISLSHANRSAEKEEERINKQRITKANKSAEEKEEISKKISSGKKLPNFLKLSHLGENI